MEEEPIVSILVIDDEPYIQEIIRRGLKCFDYQFDTASNAQEGIDKLKTQVFDLVICDIRMPGGNGVSLLKHIKNNYPDTAVIMLTAVYEVQTAVECLRAGASNYLIKPVDLPSLNFSVKEALEKRKLLLENKEYHIYLEKKVSQQTEYLRRVYLDTVKTIANCLEAKDVYTRGHSKRVTDYALQLAKAISLPSEMLYSIHLSGLLHDIGKIGIPETILNKNSDLTTEEYNQIKLHPKISIHILKPIIHDEQIIANIRHHHERFDGRGYPDGQAGENIPLGARILSVADAFDAMTSTRAYRKAMTKGQAICELENNTSTQFDPALTTIFIGLLNSVSSLREFWHLSNVILAEEPITCVLEEYGDCQAS